MDLSSLNIPDDLGQQLKPVVTCTIEGVIDADDLRELALPTPADFRPDADDPQNLKKIREKHHHVARLLAGSGMTQRMVAHITGYTEGYIGILLNNPAMQELVELYRIQQGAAAQVISEKLKTVGLKALEKLETKIEDGELDATELTSAAKLGLDRGGFGPQSKQQITTEQHIIDHAELTKLNAEARRRNSEYIVPVANVRNAIEEARQLPAPKDEGADDAA